ncbi:MAG: hypothetical protein WCI97_09815 [Bacteroidota bacterium]
MDKIAVTDYKTLLQEKNRLKSQIDSTEKQLKNKWRDLRNHYPEMILKPSLPFSDSTNQKVFNWMEWLNEILFARVFQSEEKGVKNEATKFIIRLVQVFAIRKVAGFFKKKN